MSLKSKRSTFPWQSTPHDGPGILGPPPQLNGVEFSKMGGELMRQLFNGWRSAHHCGSPRSNAWEQERRHDVVHHFSL